MPVELAIKSTVDVRRPFGKVSVFLPPADFVALRRRKGRISSQNVALQLRKSIAD